MSIPPVPQNELIRLEPASAANVELLARWTLDPVAQGPYKRVPEATLEQLRELFLHEPSRQYFLIRRLPEGSPVGRFYWRAWRFASNPKLVDWELNILLAEPSVRGRGLGSAVQQLAVQCLLGHPSTRSVFAYTDAENIAERRALEKAGLRELGFLPHPRYPVPAPEGRWLVYAAAGPAENTS
jgi:RimJ/RimL family protein N-acetyltransferase